MWVTCFRCWYTEKVVIKADCFLSLRNYYSGIFMYYYSDRTLCCCTLPENEIQVGQTDCVVGISDNHQAFYLCSWNFLIRPWIVDLIFNLTLFAIWKYLIKNWEISLRIWPNILRQLWAIFSVWRYTHIYFRAKTVLKLDSQSKFY